VWEKAKWEKKSIAQSSKRSATQKPSEKMKGGRKRGFQGKKKNFEGYKQKEGRQSAVKSRET